MNMRTTIDLPDDLFRRCKIAAARRGVTLKTLFAEALAGHLERQGDAPTAASGWRAVFGLASADDVAEVDAAIARDLRRTDHEDWS
jgi:hypothetical protein